MVNLKIEIGTIRPTPPHAPRCLVVTLSREIAGQRYEGLRPSVAGKGEHADCGIEQDENNMPRACSRLEDDSATRGMENEPCLAYARYSRMTR